MTADQTPTARTERLNMRLSPDALALLRDAATVQQQDLTAFVLGAALDKAREVLIDEQVLHLTSDDVRTLERTLDSGPTVNAQLLSRLRRPRRVLVEREGSEAGSPGAAQALHG